jgi:hypothetical protein
VDVALDESEDRAFHPGILANNCSPVDFMSPRFVVDVEDPVARATFMDRRAQARLSGLSNARGRRGSDGQPCPAEAS